MVTVSVEYLRHFIQNFLKVQKRDKAAMLNGGSSVIFPMGFKFIERSCPRLIKVPSLVMAIIKKNLGVKGDSRRINSAVC